MFRIVIDGTTVEVDTYKELLAVVKLAARTATCSDCGKDFTPLTSTRSRLPTRCPNCKSTFVKSVVLAWRAKKSA